MMTPEELEELKYKFIWEIVDKDKLIKKLFAEIERLQNELKEAIGHRDDYDRKEE